MALITRVESTSAVVEIIRRCILLETIPSKTDVMITPNIINIVRNENLYCLTCLMIRANGKK